MKFRVSAFLVFAILLLTAFSAPSLAHIGGEPGSGAPWEPRAPSVDYVVPRGEPPCPDAPDYDEWRTNQTVLGVDMQESPMCRPDNPELIAAFVRGTNNVPQELLDRNALHEDAVVKCCDEDNDGDPDVVNITLEVAELNGWHLEDDDLAVGSPIAPGITPPFWVFTPKSTIDHATDRFFDLARMPTAPIRVEQGDRVNLRLENTHYFPHTIHLHGVDHPFITAEGEGNDGVPHFSETPVLPGEARTYSFRAREPGTMFLHCHVQPDKHVMMGLATTIIIEEDRPDNPVQTFNPGAGHVRHPSKATLEEYDQEYDLIYQDVDKEMNELVNDSNDPRVVAKAMNREYDSTQRDADYFLLNGRSFPYTLRDSLVVVEPDQEVRLRISNAGEETLSLHSHGHRMRVTHADGVRLDVPYYRDVLTLTAAQRLDATLNTTDDGLNNYGPGAWFLHDHREHATTTQGINPGGDISLVVYKDWQNATTYMPETVMPLDVFFTQEYYRGELPVWGQLGAPHIFGEVSEQEEDDDVEEGPMANGASLMGLLGVLLALIVVLRRREGER